VGQATALLLRRRWPIFQMHADQLPIRLRIHG
jgi:hypothetical protein